MSMFARSPLLALVALVACIAEPYDGEVIANNPTTTVPVINGWHDVANAEIQILARNSGGTYVHIATATSASSGWVWDDVTWYYWEIENVNVPSTYWFAKPGGCGTFTTLRADVGPAYAVSLHTPWASCWDYDQTVNEFVDLCVSDTSPDLRVETCGALCC